MNERLSMTSRCSRLLVLLVSLSLSLNQDIVSANEECPPPPQREKTKPFNRTSSYPEGHMFVYACIDGYVRKVGTSAYMWCIKEKGRTPQWDNIDGPLVLVCIPDPKIKKKTKAPVAIQTTPSWRKALPTRLVKPRPTVPGKMEANEIRNTTVPAGVVSGIMVIFLIAVGVGGVVMLHRQCLRKQRSKYLPPAMEFSPLRPPQTHQPQDQEQYERCELHDQQTQTEGP